MHIFWHSIIVKQFFTIGALKISLEYDPEQHDISTENSLKEFFCMPLENPDIRFRVDSTAHFPSLDAYRKIFTANPQGLWTIFEDTAVSHYLITMQNVERDKTPYKVVKADRKFREFIIYTRSDERSYLLFPLEYPLADLAVSGHLNINKVGIILHSACISWKGRGYLFSGVSGAGKSTISEIWRKAKEAEVLTDERVLIREFNNDLWAFGTPWHGTSEIHKNMGVPIGKIFFIKHGGKNKAVAISKTDAANRLMVRCFPTFWNREGMQFAVDFCSKVAETMESYELEFVNDMSVVEYVKKLDV